MCHKAYKLDAAKAELSELLKEIDAISLQVPNLPAEGVPEGKNEDDNVEVLKWGEPKTFDFEVKVPIRLAKLEGMRFESSEINLGEECSSRLESLW